MLPNWLYGKSKSKLASILGGGGGTPADYNQVKAQVAQNAENITTLSDALEDKVALTQISNPNLLDNPWFTVNQRGETVYSAVGYSVDRWKRNVENETGHKLTIGKDNIEIPLLKGDFYQPIESVNNHWRHVPYTVSAIIDGNLYSKTFTPYDDGQNHMGSAAWGSTSIGLDRLTWNIIENWSSTGHLIGINNNSASQDHVISAVKLELGSVSTLAMDTAPNYATELLKCQRYFYKTLQFDDNGANISPNQCLAVSTTRLQGIKFPAEMRANPTITVNKVNELGSSTAITGAISQWTSKEGISYFTIADATVGNLYIVDFEASADL